MKESSYSMRKLANITIEGLTKSYNHYQKFMEELTSRHETSIDLIYNSDQPVDTGDWTEQELQSFEYALTRSTTLFNAIRIIRDDRIRLTWELER